MCSLGCLNYFRCKNGKCVSRDNVCDGNLNKDCQEDDEFPDGPGFKCVRNGRICRLPQQLLFDAVEDCDKGEDLCFINTINSSAPYK